MIPMLYDDDSTQRAYEAGWRDGVDYAKTQLWSDIYSGFKKDVEKVKKIWEQDAALNYLNDEMKLIGLIAQHPELYGKLFTAVMASILTEDELSR